MNELGDRMKQYESTTSSQTLDPSLPYIARIDGQHFSRFLRTFNKPNDIRIHRAMLETTKDLVFHFKATTGYTQSDEITLLFTVRYAKNDLVETLPQQGRVLKMGTLFAGYASTCFFIHLFNEIRENENLIQYVTKARPHFDARVFNVPENYELVNNVKWRHNFDCRRNSISSLASKYLSYKVLKGLNSEEKIAKLKEVKGVDWEEEPHWYKYGCFVKLERYDCWIFQRNRETKILEKKLVKKFRPIVREIVLEKGYSKEDEAFILASFVDCNDEPFESNDEEEEGGGGGDEIIEGGGGDEGGELIMENNNVNESGNGVEEGGGEIIENNNTN